MNKSLALISILSASFFTGLLLAQSYRWTDDQGNTVYSQIPPPDGREVKLVAPPPRPAELPENEQEKLEEQLKQVNEAEQKRQLERKALEEQRARDKYVKQQCTNARMNLETINNRPPQTQFQTSDGSYKRFTPEERAEQIKQATDTIEKYCR